MRSCCVVLQASIRPRTSISAWRLFSRNPQGHSHVFLQALSVEAEVRLPFSESIFRERKVRLSESSELDIEHTLAHRKRVWIGRHRIKANFNVSETRLDRRASSGSTFDSRAKAFFLSLTMPTMCVRATSVERERNYTSSRRSDQNSMVISFDERRAGAKLWWGRLEAPLVPI